MLCGARWYKCMREKDRRRLKHILRHCEEILEATQGEDGVDKTTFDTNRLIRNGLYMSLLQIGELVGILSDEYKAETSHIVPWSAIRATRNALVHRYATIDSEIIWKTLCVDVPKLAAFCQTQLDDSSEDVSPA